MGKAEAPAAPDYKAAAVEQGINERETATFNAALNRPDEFSSTGARQWKLKEGADPNSLKPGDYQLTTTLSPTEQKLYDMDAINRLGLGQLSTEMLDAVRAGLGTKFDMSQISQKGQIPGLDTYGEGDKLTPEERLKANRSLEGAARKFDPASYNTSREAIAKAVYDSMTRRSNTQFDRSEAALRDRLVNQGLDETGAAFKAQMADFNTAKNDSYLEAARQAEIAGSQEQTRQDTSQAQAFQQQLGANESNFSQQAAASGQNFGQSAQALQDNYSRGMASNQQANDQAWKVYAAQNGDRASSLQEQAYLRSLPLNEINAVRSGSQVNAPQFQNYATGFAAASAPLYQGVKDSYNAQVEQANAKNAGINNVINMGAKLGAAYMTGGASLAAG